MIVKKFNVMGLKAEIVRMDGLGHLCGYVEIPKGHIYHNREYDDNAGWVTVSETDTERKQVKYPKVEVHGGVTFAGEMSDGKTFCWGFDCAHYGDTPEKCSIAFVEGEILHMAKQIIHIKSEYATRRK